MWAYSLDFAFFIGSLDSGASITYLWDDRRFTTGASRRNGETPVV